MTDQHPITPPPELVEQWIENTRSNDCIGAYPGDLDQQAATQAARWGSDQELQACVKWLSEQGWEALAIHLRAARRLKPPSLKEQALRGLDYSLNGGYITPEAAATIRRAL